MNTLLSKLTDTQNPIINIGVAITLTFIVICVTALTLNIMELDKIQKKQTKAI